MKKMYLAGVLLLTIVLVNADISDFKLEIEIDETYVEYNSQKEEYIYSMLGNQSIFKKDDILFADNGFGYINIKLDDKNRGKCIVVTGGNQFLLFNTENIGLYGLISYRLKPYTYYYTYSNKDNIGLKQGLYFNEKLITDHKATIFNKGIKRIVSSSSFTEKISSNEISYSPIGLYNRYIGIFVNGYWNWELPPWVEGAKDSGLGEWLEVTYEKPTDNIVILNGYVDFKKVNLYKDNNRVKTFKITSVDTGEPFEILIELEDVVKFQYFKLPRKAEKVKLEVVSVYKGRKWDDTAVTGIFSVENR